MSQVLLAICCAVVVIGVTLYLRKNKSKPIDPRVAANRKLGLPDDFVPPEYFGPARPGPTLLTPLGIQVCTNGFERDDIPIEREGLKARVVLSRIDELWAAVRHDLLITMDSRFSSLTPEQRNRIVNLSNSYPNVVIKPSIWFEAVTNFGGTYVGGLTIANIANATVWYKSTINGGVSNWEGFVKWEFYNVALIAVGRSDLAL